MFNIDFNAYKNAYKDGEDAMMASLSRDCTLVYPSQIQPSGSGANLWLTGGMIGDTFPQQPGIAVEQTEVVRLRVAWSSRYFFSGNADIYKGSAVGPVKAPTHTIQTKGWMKDVGKLVKAAYLIVDNVPDEYACSSSGTPSLRQRYERDGEPFDPDNICPGRYVVCQWRRVA